MDDDELTVFCGNLHGNVSEELLYDLFLQIAPLKKVRIPVDNKTGRNLNYGFVTFKHSASVQYAIDILNGTMLFDKAIAVKQRNSNSSNLVQPQENNFGMLENLGQNMFPINANRNNRHNHQHHQYNSCADDTNYNQRMAPQFHQHHGNHHMNSRHDNRRHQNDPYYYGNRRRY